MKEKSIIEKLGITPIKKGNVSSAVGIERQKNGMIGALIVAANEEFLN